MAFTISSRFTFFLALAALTLAAPTDVCSIDKLVEDVGQISAQTIALDNHVLAFPDFGGSTSDAMVVHTDIQTLTNAISTTATDMGPCPPPFADDLFQNLLASVEVIIGQERQAMNDLIAKKPAFDAVGVSGAIKQDLDGLRAASEILESVWLARAPTDLLVQAQASADEINTVLDGAQAAYA